MLLCQHEQVIRLEIEITVLKTELSPYSSLSLSLLSYVSTSAPLQALSMMLADAPLSSRSPCSVDWICGGWAWHVIINTNSTMP